MVAVSFTDKTAGPEEKSTFGIRFKASYLAVFASIFFGLTCTINVLICRKVWDGPNHKFPAVSDSTHNRWQHPYYVLFMTISMCLFSILALFIRMLQFWTSWRRYLCDLGLFAALFATVCTAMSSAITVESTPHWVFGMCGGAGTGVWITLTSFFPPCASSKPWMNNVLRGIALLSAVGGVSGARYFAANGHKLGALGEYIAMGGLCIFLAAVGVKIHGYEVSVQEKPGPNYDLMESEEKVTFQI